MTFREGKPLSYGEPTVQIMRSMYIINREVVYHQCARIAYHHALRVLQRSSGTSNSGRRGRRPLRGDFALSVLWVRVLTVFAHYAFSLSRIRGSSLPEGAIRRAYIIPIGYIISARIYHMHGIYHSPQAFFGSSGTSTPTVKISTYL